MISLWDPDHPSLSCPSFPEGDYVAIPLGIMGCGESTSEPREAAGGPLWVDALPQAATCSSKCTPWARAQLLTAIKETTFKKLGQIE